MSRARKCQICTNPQASKINAALEAGVRQKFLALQFGVSKFALSRHRNRCLATIPPAAVTLSGGAKEIARWLRRADDLFLASGASGDIRGQLAALSGALKAIVAAEKQRDKAEEQAKNSAPPQGDSVEAVDMIVEKYLDSLGDAACFHCGAPCKSGRYIGKPLPDTFPALVGQEPEPTPQLQERH